MFAKERQSEMIRLLNSRGNLNTADLMKQFDVSVETIRRDLLELEKSGLLQRVHGGAIAMVKMGNMAELPKRIEQNKEGKIELCKTAAALVEEGDIICVDTGSTAIYFAEALKIRLSQLTIVTHSLDVFHILTQKEGFQVILCGGHFMKDEKAFYGNLTLETLRRLHVKKTFLFPSAIALHGGVGDFIDELQQVQQQMMQCSEKTYFLANSEKFEKHALLKLCDMRPEHVFVTDKGLNENYRQLYQEAGMCIITSYEKTM